MSLKYQVGHLEGFDSLNIASRCSLRHPMRLYCRTIPWVRIFVSSNILQTIYGKKRRKTRGKWLLPYVFCHEIMLIMLSIYNIGLKGQNWSIGKLGKN
jgi:hypothetical protein